jgi:hypothetical protein
MKQEKENVLIQNLKSSISFLKRHSQFAGDLAEGQLQLLLDTGASDAKLRAFGKDLDAANDVWR